MIVLHMMATAKFLSITLIVAFLLLGGMMTVQAQSSGQDDEVYTPEPYEVRIKKSYINGVYIPKDIQDAISELDKKIEPSALEAFKQYSEEEAASKSFFGFGRWMSHNWGLDEGSRLSFYFQNQGLSNVEDMVRVLMITYHRHINEKPLDTEDLVKQYRELRKLEYEKELKRLQETARKDTIKINKQ